MTGLRTPHCLAALLVTVLSTTACSWRLVAPTPPDPRFARERIASLAPGMDHDAVRAVLGEPSNVADARIRTEWTYESIGSRKACRVSLGPLTLRDYATERRQLALRFGADGLENATLTERLPEHTVRTRLIAPSRVSHQATVAPADRADEYVRGEMQRQKIPGLSLVVLKDGKIVKAAGYGVADRKTNTPATPETVYKIGSISKQFIATGIMLLAQDGKLRVDDPVSKYLPDTPDTWSAITIRHLLTHTSGIKREAPAFDPYKVQPDIDVIRSAYAQPLDFPTGSKWQYCNTGYFTLAEIITRVSGMPWTEYLHRKVFEPSHMGSTFPTNTTKTLSHRALGYSDNDKLLDAPDWKALRPSGAFLSTVLDLAKWDARLYTNRPLKDATRREMWTPVTLTGGTPYAYGFGWGLDPFKGHRRVRHGGSLPGFISEYSRFVDDNLSVIVLMNLDDANVRGIAEGVAALYLPDAPGVPTGAR